MKNFIIRFLDDFEEIALTLTTRVAPWLAPLGPAIMIYRASIDQLKIEKIASIFIGASVELVGIAAVHLTVTCWEWNQTKNKTDPEAPFNLTLGLSIAYLISALALSLILKAIPSVALYSPIFFFTLAGVAYVSLGLGNQLKRWKNIKEGSLKLKRENSKTIKGLNKTIKDLEKEIKAFEKQLESLKLENLKLKEGFKIDSNFKEGLNPIQRKQIIFKTIKADPDYPVKDLAKQFKVSVQTIYNDIKEFNGDLK